MSEDSLISRTGPDSAVPAQEVDVQQIHRAITREADEPSDGFEPIPLWMTIAFGGLLFWGGTYMSSYSGEYRAKVLDRPNPKYDPIPLKIEKMPETEAEYIEVGKKAFNNCVGCHQATGLGNPTGGVPPLAASEWVIGVENSEARLSRILLYGLGGPVVVRGQTYNGQMPAWGGVLKDHQIAGVLTYIRNEWGNKELLGRAPLVTTKMVNEARKKEGARGPMSSDLLKAIPLTFSDIGAAAPVVTPPAPKTAPAGTPPAAKDGMKK